LKLSPNCGASPDFIQITGTHEEFETSERGINASIEFKVADLKCTSCGFDKLKLNLDVL
jgi:hypothetical protein